MRKLARQQEDGGAEIDLTPMLDVVFIMLIFFIVTSSFVKEPGVEIFKPQAATTEACVRGTIIFAVDDRGDIYYNKNKTTIDRVNRLAEGVHRGASGWILFFCRRISGRMLFLRSICCRDCFGGSHHSCIIGGNNIW